jgi:hydroxymethylbilane synthase
MFLSPKAGCIDALPQGALLGTASLRRQAQALHRRPDLKLLNLRGNVDTRLAKLEAGEADAIILALSGLKRLGLGDIPGAPIDPVEQPPAPGQGALAIQVRAEDADAPWLQALRHRPTEIAVAAERGALMALEGSCKTAIGAHARLDGARLSLIVEALTPDGARRFRRQGEAEVGGDRGEAAARALGVRLGELVRADGGTALEL